MRFIDEVGRVVVKGGDGGNGCVSFRRERYVPKGGPDGGNGGDGGSVILKSSSEIETLEELCYKPMWKAENGKHGQGKKKHGKRGKSLVVSVPVGTIIKQYNTNNILFDLSDNKKEAVIVKGGKGGLGNAHFVSSVNQTPRWATKGKNGMVKELALELKLISDIALVGLPNAGKSSLINAITNVASRVGSYPFTTRVPVLGTLVGSNYGPRYIIADMPSLIKGACDSKGLGHKFLRHIERSKHIILVIDISLTDPCPKEAFNIVYRKLSLHSAKLPLHIKAIALNKIDMLNNNINTNEIENFFKLKGLIVLRISALFQTNIGKFANFLRAL